MLKPSGLCSLFSKKYNHIAWTISFLINSITENPVNPEQTSLKLSAKLVGYWIFNSNTGKTQQNFECEVS